MKVKSEGRIVDAPVMMKQTDWLRSINDRILDFAEAKLNHFTYRSQRELDDEFIEWLRRK